MSFEGITAERLWCTKMLVVRAFGRGIEILDCGLVYGVREIRGTEEDDRCVQLVVLVRGDETCVFCTNEMHQK